MQPLYQGSATFLGLRATFASQSEAAGRRPNFQRRPRAVENLILSNWGSVEISPLWTLYVSNCGYKSLNSSELNVVALMRQLCSLVNSHGK